MSEPLQFENRAHAGKLLAQQLLAYAHRPDVAVLALPRGGVPVASEVASRLGVALDLLIVRKLGLPGQEEFAMGAVGSGGVRVLQPGVPGLMGVTAAQVEAVTARELAELARRERLYRGGRAPLQVQGRSVVLVDDGIATGSTMLAAVQVARRLAAARVVVAVPVAAPDSAAALQAQVDQLVCLSLPPLLTSLVLVFVAARTGWFPTGGMTSVSAVDVPWGAWMADVAWHLPMPALALALPIAATFERLQAQAMRESLIQPFVVSAVARGIPRQRLLLSHAWRASLRSICAVYGLAIGALLSGSFIVEYIAAWPGLGRLMYEALRARDIYLVAGCAAMGGVFLALGGLIGDLLLVAADPRVREGEAR